MHKVLAVVASLLVALSLSLSLAGGSVAFADDPPAENTGEPADTPEGSIDAQQDEELDDMEEHRGTPCGLSGYYTQSSSAFALWYNYTIRQCNGYTVHRKVVVNNASDGGCKTIGAYSQISSSVYKPIWASIQGMVPC
jgi:hypothetical protein